MALPGSNYRTELFLGPLFIALWALVLLLQMGLLDSPEIVRLGLYGLFSLAAALGWLAGNFFLHRARKFSRSVVRQLAVVYFLGPPSVIAMVRALAPLADQRAAPLASVYALGVFTVFFSVPLAVDRWGRFE